MTFSFSLFAALVLGSGLSIVRKSTQSVLLCFSLFFLFVPVVLSSVALPVTLLQLIPKVSVTLSSVAESAELFDTQWRQACTKPLSIMACVNGP